MQISCIGCNKTTEDIHDKSNLWLIKYSTDFMYLLQQFAVL